LSPHAYFAEQLSLLWCAVRYRACSQDREWQKSSRSVRSTPGVRGAQMVKDCAAPGDVEEMIVMTTTFKFDDNCFY
jgi:hypothetical protein